MAQTKAYEEIVEFIAAGSTSESVASFRPSDATRSRVSELVSREKSSELGAEEKSELEGYLLLEHLMRLAKARAHQLVGAP